MKWRVRKLKNRWWVLKPPNYEQPWIAQTVCVTWKEAMTHVNKALVNSDDHSRAIFHAAIDTYVEEHYGRVMSPWQRDLVKRIAKGDCAVTARPYVYRTCQRIAREVVAVISTGQGH